MTSSFYTILQGPLGHRKAISPKFAKQGTDYGETDMDYSEPLNVRIAEHTVIDIPENSTIVLQHAGGEMKLIFEEFTVLEVIPA